MRKRRNLILSEKYKLRKKQSTKNREDRGHEGAKLSYDNDMHTLLEVLWGQTSYITSFLLFSACLAARVYVIGKQSLLGTRWTRCRALMISRTTSIQSESWILTFPWRLQAPTENNNNYPDSAWEWIALHYSSFNCNPLFIFHRQNHHGGKKCFGITGIITGEPFIIWYHFWWRERAGESVTIIILIHPIECLRLCVQGANWTKVFWSWT
jgi:hypothetical protein